MKGRRWRGGGVGARRKKVQPRKGLGGKPGEDVAAHTESVCVCVRVRAMQVCMPRAHEARCGGRNFMRRCGMYV